MPLWPDSPVGGPDAIFCQFLYLNTISILSEFKLISGSLIMVVGGVPPFHQRQPRPPTYFSDVQVIDLSKQARSCPNLPEYPIAMNAASGKVIN